MSLACVVSFCWVSSAVLHDLCRRHSRANGLEGVVQTFEAHMGGAGHIHDVGHGGEVLQFLGGPQERPVLPLSLTQGPDRFITFYEAVRIGLVEADQVVGPLETEQVAAQPVGGATVEIEKNNSAVGREAGIAGMKVTMDETRWNVFSLQRRKPFANGFRRGLKER